MAQRDILDRFMTIFDDFRRILVVLGPGRWSWGTTVVRTAIPPPHYPGTTHHHGGHMLTVTPCMALHPVAT